MEIIQKAFLHVGCGQKHTNLPPNLKQPGWKEVRLDIDPSVEPDIINDIRDMNKVVTCSFDLLYSPHNLEHLNSHDVPTALSEFYRVLKPGGHVQIIVPNLLEVAKLIISKGLETPLTIGNAGPLCPIDIIFGMRSWIANGNNFMCHKTGFTPDTLHDKLSTAGFIEITVQPVIYAHNKSARWDMGAFATKPYY